MSEIKLIEINASLETHLVLLLGALLVDPCLSILLWSSAQKTLRWSCSKVISFTSSAQPSGSSSGGIHIFPPRTRRSVAPCCLPRVPCLQGAWTSPAGRAVVKRCTDLIFARFFGFFSTPMDGCFALVYTARLTAFPIENNSFLQKLWGGRAKAGLQG